MLVNEEEEYFLEEEEEEEESFNDTNNTLSGDSQISSGGSLCRETVGVVTGPALKKSTAFHDRDALEQQVGQLGILADTFYISDLQIAHNEKSQLEMRKRILEEYVEHVYLLKISHQAQLDKMEEIYRTNLDEMTDVVDGDIDAAVINVRLNANRALELLRAESLPNNEKGEDQLRCEHQIFEIPFLSPLIQVVET